MDTGSADAAPATAAPAMVVEGGIFYHCNTDEERACCRRRRVCPGRFNQGQGTAQSPVVLTSINDNSVGGNTGSGTPAPADWGGVIVNGSGTLNLAYTMVRFAGFGNPYAGIYNNNGAVTLTNSTLGNNGAFGLYQSSGTTSLSDTTITGFVTAGVEAPGW